MRYAPTEDGNKDGRDAISPMHIARHPLFTAREKLEMLEEMREGVSSVDLDGDHHGFDPDDLDDAIAEVETSARSGAASPRLLDRDVR